MLRFIMIHQYLDRMLSSVINERLIESHFLDVGRIPFALRVELAVALGIVELQDRAAFLQFNTIRNRFAHNPAASLTEQDFRDFYNVTGPSLRDMVKTLDEPDEDNRICGLSWNQA